MSASAGIFDLRKLHESVTAERRRQDLSWAALSRAVGVSVSTIRRYGDAEDAEADGVLALVRWLGVAPEHFMADAIAGEPLPGAAEGYVRVDTTKIAAALEEPAIALRNRMTIQQLAGAAQTTKRTVASLIRLSQV